MEPLLQSLERLAAAIALPYDQKAASKAIVEVADPPAEVREVFQRTFLETPHGRRCLSYILTMFHWADPELSSDRERVLRNAAMKILWVCGLFNHREVIEEWLEIMKDGVVMAGRQQAQQEAEQTAQENEDEA